jgi:hypothetical protein
VLLALLAAVRWPEEATRSTVSRWPTRDVGAQNNTPLALTEPARLLGPPAHIRPSPDETHPEPKNRIREVGVSAAPIVDHARSYLETFSDLGDSD